MADETRVQVLNEPERNPETDSMWLFRSGEDGLHPALPLHRDKAKFHAASLSYRGSGYLETDGYQGYNNLPDIKRQLGTCETLLHRCPKGKEYDYSLPGSAGSTVLFQAV